MDKVDYLLKESDFVLNAMPYTPDTHHYFNAERLKLMKSTATFMNIGRGKSVNEVSLNGFIYLLRLT